LTESRRNERSSPTVRSSSIKRFQQALLVWYANNGRHFAWRNKSASSYHRVISEVLLQRTRAETVSAFFPQFVRDFPSWRKLAKAPESTLRRYLRPIGLWRRRAATIRKLSREMARRSGRFPEERAELETLPGVGQYVANSVLLFCHGKPQPLLDINMARLLERYFGPRKLADIRYDPYLQHLSLQVVTCDKPAKMNWAILDLAALVCKIREPKCTACPLRRECKHLGGLARMVGKR